MSTPNDRPDAGSPGEQPGRWQSPPPFAQQPYQGMPASTGMSPDSERTWAIASHLTGFLAAYVALGFLGPLVCMLIVGDRSPYARRHAVAALNFNLSWLIYSVVSWMLTLVLIGWVLLVALAIGYVALVIMGAVAANRGEEYRYPLTLPIVS